MILTRREVMPKQNANAIRIFGGTENGNLRPLVDMLGGIQKPDLTKLTR